MKLFAKKPCSFCGKKFFIGDEVPLNYVLDPKAQEKMGVLVVVEGNSESTESTDSEAGGLLLPPASTSEKQAEATGDIMIEEKTVYTKNALSHMNKKELLAIAHEMGVAANANMKNDTIANLILESQGE